MSTAAATERVAASLRERIVQGELTPGTPLREAALSAEFDVARNTLREVLRVLAAEDLVDVQRFRGAVVKVITAEQVRDIYVVRRTLELRAIDESGVCSPQAIKSMVNAVTQAEAAAEAGDWRLVGTRSLQFHQALVSTLGSQRLDSFFASIVAQIRLAFAAVADEADFQRPFVVRDREICDLLAAGSRASAAAALRRYLDTSEQQVSQVVRLFAVPESPAGSQ